MEDPSPDPSGPTDPFSLSLSLCVSARFTLTILWFRSAGLLMYQLLASRFPFWGGEISPRMALDDIFFDVLIRDLDFEVIADSASPEAADLCKKLLTRDPLNRVSAVEAAQHSWLRD